MSLKKYSELTEQEKKLVAVMYSDQSNLEHYLYNFDGEKYSGRQYAPPSGKDEKVGLFGTIHAEGVESTKKESPVEKVVEEVKEAIEKVVKPKRAKKK